MKTLDEVIKANECCNDDNRCEDCPYNGIGLCASERETDALHYLKIFQRHEERVHSQLDDLKEEYRPNDPLTWEELQQMTEKPVWVEYENHLSGRKQIKYKVWDVIDWITEDLILVKGDYSYKKDEFGDVWQAYRKERS